MVEKERKEEEKKKEGGGKEEDSALELMFWNSCMKFLFGTLELWLATSLLFGALVFVNMKPICMVLLVRKPL